MKETKNKLSGKTFASKKDGNQDLIKPVIESEQKNLKNFEEKVICDKIDNKHPNYVQDIFDASFDNFTYPDSPTTSYTVDVCPMKTEESFPVKIEFPYLSQNFDEYSNSTSSICHSDCFDVYSESVPEYNSNIDNGIETLSQSLYEESLLKEPENSNTREEHLNKGFKTVKDNKAFFYTDLSLESLISITLNDRSCEENIFKTNQSSKTEFLHNSFLDMSFESNEILQSDLDRQSDGFFNDAFVPSRSNKSEKKKDRNDLIADTKEVQKTQFIADHNESNLHKNKIEHSTNSNNIKDEKFPLMKNFQNEKFVFKTRIHEISERLNIPTYEELEFINGGYGIKNPMLRNPQRCTLPPARPRNDPSKFQCRVCLKIFSLQRLLNRHMKCHSSIKRYLCTFCGKGFNDTFDLKRHTRTHTGVRPYKCNFCEKSFTQRCSLESHCLKVHGVAHQYNYKQRRSKIYVCEDCGHTSSEPGKHYLHLKMNHPLSPALSKFYDKRHFKFLGSMLPGCLFKLNQNTGERQENSEGDKKN